MSVHVVRPTDGAASVDPTASRARASPPRPGGDGGFVRNVAWTSSDRAGTMSWRAVALGIYRPDVAGSAPEVRAAHGDLREPSGATPEGAGAYPIVAPAGERLADGPRHSAGPSPQGRGGPAIACALRSSFGRWSGTGNDGRPSRLPVPIATRRPHSCPGSPRRSRIGEGHRCTPTSPVQPPRWPESWGNPVGSTHGGWIARRDCLHRGAAPWGEGRGKPPCNPPVAEPAGPRVTFPGGYCR